MREDKERCAGRQRGGLVTHALFPVVFVLFPVTLAKAGGHINAWVPASSAGMTKEVPGFSVILIKVH
ncbi:MAG: hypothetical protein BGO28_02450 [Alphaproteobacteria bacterium 43-37]|nr:MAG: hypothetical protein BGO28_02450 [Alphaproteobacteria bacterium 43-37]